MRVSSRGRSARRTTARRRDRQPRRWRRIFVDLPIQAQRIPLPYIVLILATSGVLAYVAERAYWKKESCNAHPLQCGATGGIASILIVAVIGIVAFMWLTRHVRREYLWLARNEPQRLFPAGVTPPSADADIESAEQIRETIVPGLDRRRNRRSRLLRVAALFATSESVPPQLVVMQAGEGKTTLLLQLTSQLAKEDMVPVPVSLQDVREFESFLDLAREQFRQTVDEELASTDEGDRVWRWICRSGRLVVLADDLHLLEGPARTRLAAAFHEADRRHFALVVASRRDGIGPVLERWRVPIGRLSVHEACEKVSKDPAIDRIQLFTIIQAGELNASRYYLSVLRRMLQHGQPLPPVTKGSMPLEVRRSLLDCYLLAFIVGHLVHPDPAGESERIAAVEEISQRAYTAVRDGADAIVQGSRPGLISAAKACLLRSIDGDAAKLDHAILQSYLASRSVVEEPSPRALRVTPRRPEIAARGGASAIREHPRETVHKLIQRARGTGRVRLAGLVDANTPDARSALLFYAGTPHRRRQASFVISRLLKGLTDRESAQISTVILAAEIAIAAGADTHDGALIQAFSDIWPAAGALQRRTIAVTLARLKPDRALETLWSTARTRATRSPGPPRPRSPGSPRRPALPAPTEPPRPQVPSTRNSVRA